jgi:hypothetical protein
VFASLASAQITGSPGSGSGVFTCSANVANPTAARSEGYSELLGDIVITCTGGTASAIGSAVPTANITVALNNTIVTSRVFSNGLSEALLLIDEPGATGATGPGTLLPQVVCSSTQGAGPGGCSTVVQANGTGLGAACTSASTGCAAGAFPNVFQGVVSGNQVIFNGIPILAPVTAGSARVFRITNVRGNAAQFAGQSGSFQGQIPILASITISSVVTVQNPVQTTAFLFNGLGTTVVRNASDSNSPAGSSATGLLQCSTSGLTAGAVLRFPEGFANAFKTRVAPTSAYSGAGTAGSNGVASTTFTQNIPGAIYNGSESGFILGVSGGTAGLSDFGTRLKATFNNIPAGANIFVSTTNLTAFNTTGTNNPANTNTVALQGQTTNIGNGLTNQLLAGLVLSETAGSSSQGGFVPLVTNTNNSGGSLLFGPLPVDANGTATAVWEILISNPNQFETAEFGVWYTYTGNPATNTPPISPVGTVAMSFAPTFSSPTASSLIPRFTPPATSSTILSFALCQTTLLYPWVTAEPGFDTGIAIANTSSDPWGTRTQSGTCTLNFFGTGAGTTTTVTTPTINAGTVYADQVSNLKPGFRGYVFAVCNFQLAHGYALFSDTGIRNWATGYLALIVPTGTGNRNSTSVSYNPTTGGVEGLGF